MARKKRQFHCHECGSPTEIYKKGRGHRVLVCPRCGILATNPLPLLAPLLAAAAPMLIEKGGELISSVIQGKKTRSAGSGESAGSTLKRLSNFEKALLMERAERKI